MYAVIETGGQQHKVEPGRYVTVKRLAVEDGEPIVFNQVLLVRTDEQTAVGTPAVEGAVVEGRIRRHLRGKKIHGLKYKAKKRYRKHWGARADLTQVTIEKIVFAGQEYAADLTAAPAAQPEAADEVDEADDAEE